MLISFKWLAATCVAALATLGLWVSTGCARVVPPAGGAKDTLAPSLVWSSPKNGEINFKKKVVKLSFTEDVVAPTLYQELLISPYLDGNTYTFVARQNKVEIAFVKELPPNVTITLNFRNAVADFTEKLPAKGLKLAFATGNILDTLLLQGTVTDWLTTAPQKGITVALWPSTDTLSIRKQKPIYLTQTTEAGAFVLENIKAGRYHAVAFEDKNKNAQWDGKKEKLAFLAQDITLASDTTVSLILATLDDEPPMLERQPQEDNGLVEFDFSEGLQMLALLNGSDTLASYPATAKATTFITPNAKPRADTVRIRILAQDSSGNTLDTLAKLAPTKKKPEKAQLADTGKTKKTARINVQDNGKGGVFLPEKVILFVSEPLSSNLNVLEIPYATEKFQSLGKLKFIANAYRTRYTAEIAPFAGTGIKLLVPAGLLTTSGIAVKKDTITIALLSEDKVGLIRGQIAPRAQATILELLDSKGQIARTFYSPASFVCTGLLPDTYTLRLTIDTNKNKLRDAPNYKLRQKGELILPLSAPVQVKANWEVDAGTVF